MIALFLDTETTGLDPSVHHLAEVCAVLVDCHDDGTWRVLRALSFLVRDPGPMDAEVQRLTHLTPELCDAHGLTTHAAIGAVQRLADCAEAIVAWNAPFDRAFLEAAGLATSAQWVDAQRNVDWRALGASRDSLVVVLAEVGRAVNPCPHSALGDVMGMVQLVAPRIREAVADAKVPRLYLSVVHSPYGANDALKELGYRWDGARRVWELLVVADALQEERSKLPEGCFAWHSEEPLPVVPLVSIEVNCRKEHNEHVARHVSTRWDGARKIRVADNIREDYARQVLASEIEGCGFRIVPATSRKQDN